MGSRSAWFTQQVLGQPGYVVRPYLKTIYPNISFGDICVYHIYAYRDIERGGRRERGRERQNQSVRDLLE